jgi:2,6-dihydroxypyridine 3-monooxygenase
VRIAIVGGSLGGLTAGLLLRDLGHDVTIYERSPTPLEQRGAGIGFLPETARYLHERAGVDLDDISVTTHHIRYLDRSGSIVHDKVHTYRLSSWNAIYRQSLRVFGRERYQLDAEVASLVQQPEGRAVELRFASGGTIAADLVVCADGVGSRFRSWLMPDVTQNYSGYVAWRGMVPEAEVDPDTMKLLGDALTYVVSANSHILVYPIPGLNGSVKVGERLMNFVWYRNYLEGGDLDDLLFDVAGTKRDVSIPPGLVRPEHVAEMKAVANARLPQRIAAMVNQTKEPFIQVVVDVEVPRMRFGRICLLGDAAWVARPHAAAGTAKAADDAWSLAEALDTQSDVETALEVWEQTQLAVGRQLVDRTRTIGRQSQFDGNWVPGDPDHIFGLHGPGR